MGEKHNHFRIFLLLLKWVMELNLEDFLQVLVLLP
jgi:hypothetical protein